VDGTWVAPGVSGAGVPSAVIHSGYGTGALAGLRIQLRAKVLPDGYAGAPPCADPLRVVEDRGVILEEPGSH